ncbi:MAG: RagB/SusD family nutrient uptake outer membrane protein [Bacteroidales bacterium]|nr:RagB/SusD family nutrient uptake outer membrane protein [Bacteroidales bacterium]
MKKIFIALIAVASLLFTGCEKRLDIPRKGVIDLTTFYQTDADAESALVAAYYTAGRFFSNTMWTTAGWNDCPFLSMWEYASDEIYVAGSDKTDGQSGNEIQAFRMDYNNSLIAGTYECYYMIIKACNDVIDNFAEAADTQVKKRCVAEARVLRAQAQLLLALAWGTAPIVENNLAGDAKPANAESQEAVLQWVADECDKAIPDLTSKTSVNDKKGAVKITKEFAYALKGKALISKHDYAGAKTALKQVIDSKLYALVPGEQMASLNHNSGRATSEAVFELNFQFFDGMNAYGRTQPNFRWLWSWRSDHMNCPTGDGSELVVGGWGWVNPSQKFVDKIIAYDGLDSYRRKAWIKTYDEVLYEMPYSSDKEGMTLEEKMKDKNRGVMDSGLYGHVGYFMWKRLFRSEDRVMADGNVANWNLTLMRYAEVLLLYAEACAKTNDDGSGLKALQEVNERAGGKTKVTALTMDAVKTEKFLEGWLDGTRFQDLIRWGDAATELANNGKYYPTFYDAMSKKGESEHRGYIDESDADWCAKLYSVGFKSGKNELFPFPFNEMQLNPNLSQNPGY